MLAAAAEAHDALPPLEFEPPAPGSYRLDHIMAAPDGAVLDVQNRRAQLSALTAGRVTLLSFVYTHCSDEMGCPLAYGVMDALRSQLAHDPASSARVQFISLSFDPRRDTPEVMKLYGGDRAAARQRPRWYFLTTASPRELKPLLDGFGQDLSFVLDEEGRPTGTLSHVLKVFLIDPKREVREIYSTSYLQPRMVLNDIRTLLLEDDGAAH